MVVMDNGTYRITQEYIRSTHTSGETLCFLDVKNANGYKNICSGSKEYCIRMMANHRTFLIK
jgi:hypothetical protein